MNNKDRMRAKQQIRLINDLVEANKEEARDHKEKGSDREAYYLGRVSAYKTTLKILHDVSKYVR